ncbi:tetratricopeptide repeat protein [Bremerella sp. JC817]|uniref:tetratricopeptide repeat protein n=1 Tax=Bremerella sp. JC817 TaxID=3231756 RepID=UPI00345A0FBF
MTEPTSPETPSPAPTPPVAPAPPRERRVPIASMLLIAVLLFTFYGVFSFFTSDSAAQWKWAEVVEALENDQNDQAKQLANEALELDPEDPQLRLNAAEMYFRLDDETEARKQIEEAIALGKEKPQVLHQAAFILSRMGQHDGALFLADKVVDLAETKKTIHLHQALNQRAYTIAMAAGDDEATPEQIEQGMKDITRAIDMYGHEATYIDTMGYLKVFAGDPEGGLHDLDTAIEFYESRRTKMLQDLPPEQIENMPKNVASLDKQLKQVLSVLYSHRATAYEKLEEPEKAQEDRDRADAYGLDRKRGFW